MSYDIPTKTISSDVNRCNTNYHATWLRLVEQQKSFKGIVRDMELCLRHNGVAGDAFSDHPPNGVRFSCKRPGCLRCWPLKVDETRQRLAAFCGEGKRLHALSFTAAPVPVEQTGASVAAVLGYWANAIRSKRFRHCVAEWVRTVELTPHAAGEVRPRLNTLISFRPKAKPDADSVISILHRRGMALADQQVLTPDAIDASLLTLARSGFDPTHFCVNDPVLPLVPVNLAYLHDGLRARRLVCFSGHR